MLTIVVPEVEFFNQKTEEFVNVESFVLTMEHSLVSLSKWEARFNKPFLGLQQKTSEENAGYVEAMILNAVYPTSFWERLSQANLDAISDYIESPQSATTFGKMPETKGRGEVVTSELIYYWMVAFNIPFECERWHLNRLFALIRIANIKNSKPKQMSRSEIAQRNRELNAQRREQYNTAG